MRQVIDRRIVEELLADGRDGGLPVLIRSFGEDGPDHVESVLQGLEDQDLVRVQRAALSLRGVAGNLGAQGLLQVCERLHAASRRYEWQEVRELTGELKARFEEAFQALERLIGPYG